MIATTIDNHKVCAARTESDENGNRVDTTYSRYGEIPDADKQKILQALGADRTVLFSGAVGMGTLSLSEDPKNFEYLEIYFSTPNGSPQQPSTSLGNISTGFTRIIPSKVKATAIHATMVETPWSPNFNNMYHAVMFLKDTDTATWAVSNGIIQVYSNKSLGTGWVSIYSVVGVHRIAGGS